MSDPSGQPAEERQAISNLLGSIDAHPGLQTVSGPDGLPAMDDASVAAQATEFLREKVPGGQPAQAQAPATSQEQPTATPGSEQASATGGRLLAGKYRSVDELERAQIDAQRTLREREAALRAARAVNQHLDEVFAPLRQPREEKRDKPIPVTFDERQQPIIDPAAVMDIVREVAREVASQQVQDTLRPLSQLSQANARLRNEYPEVAQREGEFAQWMAANPEYGERVSRDPDFYLEGAYLKFERERGMTQGAQNANTASAAQEQVSRARANASPAGGGPVATRRQTEQDATQANLNALKKYAVETGDWKPYTKARLEGALGTGFVDTLQRTTWGR